MQQPRAGDLLVAGFNPLPVTVDLNFRATDPYAVNMDFHCGDGKVITWTFARELLANPAATRSTYGDVSVWRQGGKLHLLLDAPSGTAEFEFNPQPVVSFVATMHAIVPAGQESKWLDLDGLIRQLLDS